MRHLKLIGSPAERGHTHGIELRAEIQAMLQRWDSTLRQDLGMSLDSYVERYLAETNYVEASRHFAPEIMSEVEGIAAGAEIAIETAFSIQASLDEHWHHRESLPTKATAVMDRCSGFGIVQQGQPTILAQNQDLPTYLDGAQIMLEVEDKEHDVRILMPSIAGFIGLHGMNDRGVGNCVNTLAKLSCDTTGPLSTFVIRAMLNCHSFSEAVELVRSAGHTVGLNYIIADPTQVVDLETSANQVAEYRPHPTKVYHTNHPLQNDDFAIEGETTTNVLADEVDEFNTEERFAILENALGHDAPFNVTRAQALLSGKEGHVCRVLDNQIPAFTFTSTVMELGATPAMYASAGPPSEVPYETFYFQ